MKKFSKTALAVTFGLTAITGATIAISTYKASKPFKPSFYNYKSYMSQDNQNYLRTEFDYKQFDEINQFTNALINHKAIGGIGSDFLAASLIQKGLIKKINYQILFDDEDLNSDKYTEYQKRQIIKNALRAILRKEIWSHLESYNKFLVRNNKKITTTYPTGEIVEDEFWEYFLPYYSQDMVVSYNLLKQNSQNANKVLSTISSEIREDWSLSNFPEIEENVKELQEVDFTSEENELIKGTESPTDLVNILRKLSSLKYNQWTITDALRDNMLYGSSYWKKANSERTANDFTGEVKKDTYQELINSFTDLVFDGTGYRVTDSNHISFKGDGLELLNNLINLSRLDVKAAIMYNGDGLDAYYGADNLPGWSIDGSTKSIKPKHNLLLVDGVVFSANNTDKNNNKYLKTVADSIYSNFKDEFKTIKEHFNSILFNDNFEQNITNKFAEFQLAKLWEEIKLNNINDALELDDDLSEKAPEIVAKFRSIIDLSNEQNQSYFNEFYSYRAQHQAFLDGDENSEEVELDKRINYAPVLFANYLTSQKSNLLNSFAVLVKNNKEASDNKWIEEFETNLVDDEEKLLWAMFNSFLSENEDFVNELKQSESDEELITTLANTWAKVVTYLNIEDDKTLTDHLNINNFSYINYTPSINIDYEIVLRNYFADPIDGMDEEAINLYEIVNSQSTIHKSIAPINDQLYSLITTYYREKTKS